MAWEEAAMREPGPADRACVRGPQCKGVTAQTWTGPLGRPLRAFALPSGRVFDECVLCIRARVSARWYEVLRTSEMPAEPIHPWCVRVDVPGEYDAALCIGPVACAGAYVGVVAPFPRYDETALALVPGGFAQVHCDYREIPRLCGRSVRVGARPLGFAGLWRAQIALVYAGLVHHVSRERDVPSGVCDVLRRCVLRMYHGRGALEAERAAGASAWLDSVIRASAEGVYAHCTARCAVVPSSTQWEPRDVIFFVREHATFLVERDSPELYAAVCAAHPTWPTYVAEVRKVCDEIRVAVVGRRVGIKARLLELPSFRRFARETFDEPRDDEEDEGGVVALDEMKAEYARAGAARAQAFAHSLLSADARATIRAAAREGWRDRFAKSALPFEGAPIVWYVCSSCGEFKSVTSRWGGCEHVAYDIERGVVRCHKTDNSGRKALLELVAREKLREVTVTRCGGVVEPLEFGTHVVNLDFVAHVACAACREALVPLDFRTVCRGLRCVPCAEPPVARTCEVCAAPVSSDAFRVRGFDARGLRDVFFCRQHTHVKIARRAEVWALDALMPLVYAGVDE